MVKKNLNIEEVFFEYKSYLMNLEEYRQVEILALKNNFQVEISFYSEKIVRKVYYFVRVCVLDSQNNLIQVPESSEFFDSLGALLASECIFVHKVNSDTIKCFSISAELIDDLKMIIRYLEGL